jgi:ribosomal protein S18 acetylase RimI-like enzyme
MTISIDDLERAASYGWRAPEEAALGDWALRAAGGFTGRANSALAIGDPGLPLATAVERVCQWYRTRDLPPMVALAFPLVGAQDCAADRYLAECGWPVHHGAVVMTAEAGTIKTAGTSSRADLASEPDGGWLSLYRYRGQVPPPISGHLLRSAPWQAFASVSEAGRTVAIGRVAAAAGWAGLTAIEVHPEHRRQGLGQVVTAALVAAAADYGSTAIYLQVEADNWAARAMYTAMGFTDHHGYHYRVAPATDCIRRQPPA